MACNRSLTKLVCIRSSTSCIHLLATLLEKRWVLLFSSTCLLSIPTDCYSPCYLQGGQPQITWNLKTPSPKSKKVMKNPQMPQPRRHVTTRCGRNTEPKAAAAQYTTRNWAQPTDFAHIPKWNLRNFKLSSLLRFCSFKLHKSLNFLDSCCLKS